MEHYILLCLDCQEIFQGSENHICKEDYTSKADKVNKRTQENERLDDATIKFYKRSFSGNGTENGTQTSSTTEEAISDRVSQEIKPYSESFTEENVPFSWSSASNIQRQVGNSRDDLSMYQPEQRKSNLDVKLISQDDTNNQNTDRDASNVQSMSDDNSVVDSYSSTSPKNINAFAGPSNIDVEVFRRAEDGHILCPTCGKTMRSRSAFINHYRTHTGEKPYDCDMCEKKFATQSNLKKHRNFHTGEKPFACNVCEKKYTTKNSLNVHLRAHTGERPYKCSICGKTFTEGSGCKRHMKSVHNEK